MGKRKSSYKRKTPNRPAMTINERRARLKNVDALGCYKKFVVDGVPVAKLDLSNVPVKLQRRFKAACLIHGDVPKRAFMRLMVEYCKAIEERYNVYLEPELPEQ